MKILTVCIVCNEENSNLNKIVESCLLLKEDIEVLVLGEEDNDMLQEAQKYAEEYPEDVKVHISPLLDSLQNGIQQANGLYFKLFDSKDSLDTSVLVKVVETFKDLLRIQANLDMMICDYEYPRKKKKRDVVEYVDVFPLDKVFEWHQTKAFKIMCKMSMEGIIVKTNILKKLDLSFFYNQYIQELLVLKILPSIKSMYYLDKTLQHIDSPKYKNHTIVSLQQYHTILNEIVDTVDITNIESRKFRNYMINHINSLLLYFFNACMKQNSIEARVHKEEILEHIILENTSLYRALRKTAVFKLYSSDVKLSNVLIARKYKNMK
ncbi:MAG: hypothetical protein ACK5LC_09820 [Coprobacillaceae bacterium]